MLGSHFKRVIVIGYGVIAHDVLEYADMHSCDFGYETEYIEYEIHEFNLAQKYAKARGITSHVITDKKLLYNYIMACASEKILIVSANNNYIFPQCMTEHENIIIINFHNALLPKFPGRNAPSWAVFEKERITGITWHYVTAAIDGGDIIIQKEHVISNDVKAYELVATLMKLAAQAFQECFFDILKENIKARRQEKTAGQRLYLSKDVPGDGKFELTDSVDDIYRLLRALDYGKNDIFPAAMTTFHGEKIRVKRYRLVNKIEPEKPYRIYLPIDKDKFLMIIYDVLNMGSLGGVIETADELYSYVGSLKKSSRHLVSNFHMSEEEIERHTKECGIYYKFVNNKYLNLWVYEHDFMRIFFFIACISEYRIPDIKKKVVCDIFFQKGKNAIEIVSRLKCLNLYEYVSYTKWIKKETKLFCECDDMHIRIESGAAEGFYKLLCQCFDIYSDVVPEEKNAVSFFNNKKCYTAYQKKTDQVIGGIVISVHGNIQTEEFVFVRPDMRGQQIAKCLHKRWYDETNDAGVQYYAWIRDNNKASISLHTKIGYVKHNSSKLTMIKEK